MKKILLLASAVVGMLAAGSCQREIEYLDGDTKVTFEVSTGDLATKASAIADASNITVLHWELYGPDIRNASAPYGEDTVIDTDRDKKFTVELRLVADQEYNIVFWAETAEGSKHYVTKDLRKVEINTYADESANDETRAAFFAVHNFVTENGVSVKEDVTLYRPFSQINLGATTYETSLNLVNGGKVIVGTSEMTVNSIANAFNTLDGVGQVQGAFDGKVTFKAAATPNKTADQDQKLLTVNGEDYFWIGMNYLIVEGNTDAVNVDVKLATNMGEVNHSIGNVPIKENYRTNILGDFLTTGAKFDIVVDETFESPDYVVDPNPVVNEKLHMVQTHEELLKYAYMVNHVDNTLELELLNDIALPQFEIAEDAANETYVYTTTPITVTAGVPSGSNWVPMGDTNIFFEGKINGGNHTISGLRIASTGSYVGFAGIMDKAGTVIMDLNFDDAVISGVGCVGTVAGYARDGVVLKNCHLSNVAVKGTEKVGAVIGQNYTRHKATPGIEGGKLPKTMVENCTVDAASTVSGSYNIGGVAGINYGAIIKNCRNASKVTGLSNVGGIAGYSRDYHNYKNSWVIACGNEGEVSGNGSVGSIIGQSLEDNNHTPSISAMVACYSTAQTGAYTNLLLGTGVNNISNYGSWGLKTKAYQNPLPAGTYTACYAFDSAASISQAEIDAMNAAIDEYNTGLAVDAAEYCPYKWDWTAGSLPVLK